MKKLKILFLLSITAVAIGMLFYGSNINFNNDVGKNNKSSKNAGAIHHGTTEVKTISNAEITTSINNEEQDEPKIDRYHSDLENFKNDLKDTIDSEYLAIINNDLSLV